ncbi:hypothetical protein [Burkholderia cenocepacia]|uniref:hypothetical protein n=1 Tax=Burkholderia cenocepacia TaxID=95486 RepID=UPI0013DF4BED|nr:hypothetical protein [Burkholderia cenocepacia]MCW3587369.1 hypothetical protein [Burkholderia cenocepacia]MCW3632573.1 hypothetical protein [Burkholderia cenocepacia]MCW5181804.1 hypothetical protein [Burkholderia cenocepacia]NGO98063.1 hypothetical protein [Burkholderia cenocepacia]
MQKILVDKAALDALLKSATPFHEGDTSAIADELSLNALVPESLAAARARRRTKAGESHIDPLDQLSSVVIGVPESMHRYIRAQVGAANTNVQAYTRAVFHLAMRTGMMERITAAMQAEREDA